jgi:Activator of Hsp90 ATPase homolog 1-like protein
VTEPLRLSFGVSCRAVDAFDMWTRGISMWWPTNHTVSGDRDALVIIEPQVGGRIFERAPWGAEFDWGWITRWQPPLVFAYRWHIASLADTATEVEIRFIEQEDRTTLVEIEHSGFDALGAEGPLRRDGNRVGWDELIPSFVAACAARQI